MNVGICGGGLQGVELCFLARKAGWNVTLCDVRKHPPASGLCDRFCNGDVRFLHEDAAAACMLEECDILIPAIEDVSALESLAAWCAAKHKAFAFDKNAFAVTSSKIASRELFLKCGTPIPTPSTGFSGEILFVKPSGGSGSRGVRRISTIEEYQRFKQEQTDEQWIMELYCPGPSYSLEVCGTPGNYEMFQVTDLFMDDVYDCRAVAAPCTASLNLADHMKRELGILAESLQLHGLMDIEVIDSPEGMKVLEIDARFPSQTPTAVWLSTGMNMIERLVACFIPCRPASSAGPAKFSFYEHVLSRNGMISSHGEHIVASSGPLIQKAGFFGADEALIGTIGGYEQTWVATLMFADRDRECLLRRRQACLEALQGKAWRDVVSA